MAVMSPEGVRSTPRDIQVLRWLGEQYGAPLAVFAELLARYGDQPVSEASRATLARYHAGRLERLGFAQRHWTAGQRWIVPTQTGLRQADLPFEAWEPVGWKLDHVATVGRLRLWVADAYPADRWVSERWVRHRWYEEGVRGLRVPDAALLRPSGAEVAVEVELHRKARDRYPHILHAISSSIDEVWWFTPAADVAWLRGVLEPLAAGPRPIHRVVELPEGVIAP